MTAKTPSAPRASGSRPAGRTGATCCHCGRKRPKVDPLTGSVWARAAASERERIVLSTSGARNSGSSTPWRYRPSTTVFDAASVPTIAWATLAATPKASRTSSWVNGPRVLAHRATSCSRASGMTSALAGTPGGTGTPRPSRSNAASRDWATCSTPAMRTRIRRWPSSRSASSTVTDDTRPTSSSGTGPMTRSVSMSCSAVVARRRSDRLRRSASTSAMMAGSNRSRSSTPPRSWFSRAGSSASAAARFSANGPSPSYMKAPV